MLLTEGGLLWSLLLIYFLLFSIWVGSLFARLYGPAMTVLGPAGKAFGVF